jgi:hypothetical protein
MTLPTVRLSDVELHPVAEYTYLGHIITSTLSDTRDMEKQYRGLCVRANMLIRRFSECNDNVKSYLFKKYCTTLYCFWLWVSHNTAALNKLKILHNNAYR